ncbi:hypothetical protein RHSIM_Rhsim08G0251000 [Rhododendron simsii]|uniref:Uncharacterized protein n=1 Tax=Rhododendron simsii TaxID=118357 RepID=A0A834GNR4_RHOSS|nr:hypothetical protein RHSIM_Rhsim08G0251000 [Rhododendron simsii]
MAKKGVTRRELLDRWRGIEENDDDDDDHSHSFPTPDSSSRHRLRLLKEEWFADAFSYLVSFPKQNHIWCGSWDLMGPLLETFYNYFKDERHDSPLKILWKRISEETQRCTQCICQHHQAQEMYHSEYEWSSIGPLLDVLRSLDEERVTQHLKEINSRITKGVYDPVNDSSEVVSVMFEVLMFPMLLDDQSLVTEFQVFIEAIDNSHELSLAGHQQSSSPLLCGQGVYALFFLKSRRARSIGLRLAGNMGKLSGMKLVMPPVGLFAYLMGEFSALDFMRATDLEPLQPLLKKCIGLLETEVLPLAVETSRPRVQLERTTVWLGIKALLGFLEPPAFEEGILERYPIFLSIVLNHISDDSGEFSYAVNCLRLLFEMLGCKLWLRATLSPSVMRNTLLGMSLWLLLIDFTSSSLFSLEALQDGEHEKQRRHFIYFLLHQVPFSSNFSILMRKKACQIALLIIHRGYKMIPPCPPFECAHMWGPSLVSSLKDSSLHSSLRQPAFDLFQTIVVSDAAILASSILNCHTPPSISKSMSSEFNDEDEDEGFLFTHDVEEKDDSCWNAFSVQGRITSQEFGEWMCIPMLWIDVLLEIDPLVLPVSFSKAVLWALSRLSMVEPEKSTEMALPARDWLSTCASEISHLYGWRVPSGSDDGGEGKDSKNSIKVSKMCVPLIKTFKRLTAHFAVKMEQGELRKQWTWEPRMSESLILLLVDPNDNARQVGRSILEQVSNTRGLACGLQFLCSCSSSLSAVLFGLKHASKLVQLDSVLLKFQTLHHFFFVLCKLLREGVMSSPTLPGSSSDELNILKVSSQGGFLRQPLFDSLRKNVDMHLVSVDLSAWEEFNHLLAGITWPFIRKCLEEGKTYMNYKISQLDNKFDRARVLIIPMVKCLLSHKRLGIAAGWADGLENYLKMVLLQFKTMTCIRLLELLPVVFEKLVPSFLKASGKILDNSTDCLLKQSYSDVSIRANIGAIEKLIACETVAMDELIDQVAHLSVALSEGSSYIAKDNTIIVLSDDETQMEVPANKSISHERAMNVSTNDTKLIEDFQRADGPNCAALVSKKLNSDMLGGKRDPGYLTKSKALDSNSQDRKSKLSAHGSSPFQGKSDSKNSSGATLSAKSMDQVCINKDLATRDTVIKQLVCDAEDDPWESSVKNSMGRQSRAIKPSTSGPKRQVIQLNMGMENRSGNLHRLEGGVKRFKPPALDDWYRPILEIDYFATVGLAPASEEENESLRKLKEVPVSFQSPNEYVEILRPLVLEEFKAQLHSCFLEMSSSEEMCCGTLSVLSVERIDDFHLVRCIHDDGDSAGSRSFSENDLILLTRQLLKVSSHDVHMVGKVERHQKDFKRRSSILVIRFYLQNGSSRLNRARKLLIERSKWHVARIMSITSQLREFQALSSINGIPLLPIILNPINHSFGHHESRKGDLSKLPQPLQRVLKSSYNDCQLQAIGVAIEPLDSKKEYDLSLIQGPPGTGKTRTILAIVSALLAYYLQRRNDMKRPPNGSLKPIHNPFSNLKSRISQSTAIARAWQDAALARQLDEDLEKSSKSIGSCTRGRVLICAQSNAAVDELVSRISSEGLYGSDGAKYKPFLVRVGNAKTVHPNSLPFFIDTLVDHKLAEERINAGDAKSDTVLNSSMALRANLEKLVDRIRFYETKRANLRDGNSNSKIMLKGEASKGNDGKEMSDAEIDEKLRKLYAEKKTIYRDLSSAQAKEKKANDEIKALKHKFRRSILREAEIVITTLSGCGGDLYGVCSESLSNHKFSDPSEHALFDAVVIDEAAQALEPATLIPLQLLKSKGATCIMVGDPKQLPATVLSNVASKYLYQCSMFERLQRAGHPVIMLTEQYRMHPEICWFPSLHFYDRKLVNGDQMSDKSASFHATEGLGPYLFFDVVDGHELHGKNSGGLSLYNESEADAAVEILSFFKKRYPSEFRGGRIGIITPYKSQLSLLRSRFSSAFGPSVTAEMEFNTVDGFQGREVDILVLSTVRAAEACSAATKINSSNIGFVADVRRMNVSLTRARLSLWVLGNARTLQTNHNWAALVRNAKERNLVVSVKKPYESLFKSAFKKLPALENSSYCSKELKHDGKIKEPGSHAGSNLKAGDETDERKKRHIGSGARIKKDPLPVAVASSEGSASKSLQSAIPGKGGTAEQSRGRGNGERQLHTQSPNLTEGKSKFENRTSNIDESDDGKSVEYELLKPIVSNGLAKPDKHSRKQRKMEAVILSSVRTIQGRDGNDRGRASNQANTPKDAIAKRKQQRDDVDALLSSALISSKKTETSLRTLPVKRPGSPKSRAGGGIKPPKPRKGFSKPFVDDAVDAEIGAVLVTSPWHGNFLSDTLKNIGPFFVGMKKRGQGVQKVKPLRLERGDRVEWREIQGTLSQGIIICLSDASAF